jgi:hypothetical protein
MKFYGAVANSMKIGAIKTILYVRALMKFCPIFYIFIPVLVNTVLVIANTIYRAIISFMKISTLKAMLYLRP